jgi:hypothetical protein
MEQPVVCRADATYVRLPLAISSAANLTEWRCLALLPWWVDHPLARSREVGSGLSETKR